MSSAPILALLERAIAMPRESPRPEFSRQQVASALCNLGEASTIADLELTDATLGQLMAESVDRACFQLHKVNQFQPLSDATRARLRDAVVHWFRQLKRAATEPNADDDVARILDAANQALRDAIQSCQKDEAGAPVAVSAEYTIETQLEVLHVDPTRLPEPILDLGCGREAALVTWLRQRKVNAIGIDKFAPARPGCVKADWLQTPYPPEQFGSVLSHLGFSLHFLHQHLRSDGQAQKYASAYMALLRSLRPLGVFAYAPGLPFIEQLLPRDQYKVEKHAILSLPIDERGGAVFEQGLGESPMYAAHVTRLSRPGP